MRAITLTTEWSWKDVKRIDIVPSFDDSSIASSTAYFEKVDDIITENRRLLYHVMTEQGFTNYSE